MKGSSVNKMAPYDISLESRSLVSYLRSLGKVRLVRYLQYCRQTIGKIGKYDKLGNLSNRLSYVPIIGMEKGGSRYYWVGAISYFP